MDMGRGKERVRCMERVTWKLAAAAAAKSLQSCPTLCDPIDGRNLVSYFSSATQERTP